MWFCFFVFFFKQKTAYEMRISDWSSDVCSSDLRPLPANVTLRHVDLKRLRAEVDAITNIFNDAWSGNWGFVPLSEAETDHLAKSLRPLLHEKLVWFVDVDGEPAGFIVCLPKIGSAHV